MFMHFVIFVTFSAQKFGLSLIHAGFSHSNIRKMFSNLTILPDSNRIFC